MKSSEFIREATIEQDRPAEEVSYCPGTAEDIALANEINSCTFGEAMSIEDAIAMAGQWESARRYK